MPVLFNGFDSSPIIVEGIEDQGYGTQHQSSDFHILRDAA
jgi:hypothetical protein